MSQQYDPLSMIDKVETRLQQQMDRRFNEFEKRFDKLERLIEQLDVKINANTEKLEARQYEKSTWTIRQMITITASFVLGGGAIGLVETISNILRGK